MDVEEGGRREHHPLTIEEDENLFELEIKNLDTNEVYKMQIPIDEPHQMESLDQASSGRLSEANRFSNPNYASRRRNDNHTFYQP